MSKYSGFAIERFGMVVGTTALLAMVWVHALTALLGLATGGPGITDLSASGWRLTCLALAVGLIAGALRRWQAGLVAGVSAAAVLVLLGSGALAPVLALLSLGPILVLVGRALDRRLPSGADGFAKRRPWAAVGLSLMLLLALVQVGRLSAYMGDPTVDWFLTSRNPLWAKHECLSAYLFGAELQERGEVNVYDALHYPGLNPAAEPVTDMTGMAVEDPYQYPPQFLLLPRAARALTRDFASLRVVWFSLQATLFLAVAWSLVLWVGGREGLIAASLIPLAISAFPALHALQYGQFQLAAVALSLAALLAFESRRLAAGGLLLAIAITAKVFPGLLLVPMLVRRRWGALAWTAGFGLVFALLGWFVLGPAPYSAFFDYQLPRLADGQAFAFGEAWPEIREVMIADNQGAYGLVLKLQAMGAFAGSSQLAESVAKGFGFVAVVLTALFASRGSQVPRHLQVAGWLAILGLGSLVSPGAFGDYVPLTATWLLTFVATSFGRGWRWALPLGVCWVFQYTLLGTAPIGTWMDTAVLIPISVAGSLSLFGLYFAVISGRFAAGTVTSDSATQSEPVSARMVQSEASP